MIRAGIVGAVVLLASAVAFVAMWRDKRAAERNARRTPEATLHLIELAGGWPGSLVAQRLFRHKTRKLSYQVVFWCCALVNAGVALWLLGVLPRG